MKYYALFILFSTPLSINAGTAFSLYSAPEEPKPPLQDTQPAQTPVSTSPQDKSDTKTVSTQSISAPVLPNPDLKKQKLTSSLPTEPKRHNSATIKNECPYKIRIEYRCSDEGFLGAHVITKRNIDLRPKEVITIKAYTALKQRASVNCIIGKPEVKNRIELSLQQKDIISIQALEDQAIHISGSNGTFQAILYSTNPPEPTAKAILENK